MDAYAVRFVIEARDTISAASDIEALALALAMKREIEDRLPGYFPASMRISVVEEEEWKPGADT